MLEMKEMICTCAWDPPCRTEVNHRVRVSSSDLTCVTEAQILLSCRNLQTSSKCFVLTGKNLVSEFLQRVIMSTDIIILPRNIFPRPSSPTIQNCTTVKLLFPSIGNNNNNKGDMVVTGERSAHWGELSEPVVCVDDGINLLLTQVLMGHLTHLKGGKFFPSSALSHVY